MGHTVSNYQFKNKDVCVSANCKLKFIMMQSLAVSESDHYIIGHVKTPYSKPKNIHSLYKLHFCLKEDI